MKQRKSRRISKEANTGSRRNNLPEKKPNQKKIKYKNATMDSKDSGVSSSSEQQMEDEKPLRR